MTNHDDREVLHDLQDRLYRTVTGIPNLTVLHKLAANDPRLAEALRSKTTQSEKMLDDCLEKSKEEFNKLLNKVLIKAPEEFLASLETHLNEIFKHIAKNKKGQFTTATYYAAFDLIRPVPDKERLQEFEDPEKYPDEWLKKVGLVRLKSKRIVPVESSEAVKREIAPLLKALSGLNTFTRSSLASDGVSGESIDALMTTCQKLIAESNRGRTADIRNERVIGNLASVFAKFMRRRPAKSGLNSLFTQYVLACHQAVNANATVETINEKIKAYDQRHPFASSYDEDGNLL